MTDSMQLEGNESSNKKVETCTESPVSKTSISKDSHQNQEEIEQVKKEAILMLTMNTASHVTKQDEGRL
jgi:hypothetical protein